METIINTLFNLSLSDRLFVVERLLSNNKDCLLLPMEQLEQAIKNVVENSQIFLDQGQVKPNQVYKSRF